MTTNIMIVGVGGQGSLLASKILGNAAMMMGKEVKVSEVHGMSQRGGSVVTYVKFGDAVYSPVICRGESDVILSFEQLEAARWLPYLKKGGTVITNTQKIHPMPVITGAASYPDAIIDKIAEADVKIISADALTLAAEAGSEKAVNVVLMGMAAPYLGIPTEVLREAVAESVPEKFKAVNLAAFDMGHEYALAK